MNTNKKYRGIQPVYLYNTGEYIIYILRATQGSDRLVVRTLRCVSYILYMDEHIGESNPGITYCGVHDLLGNT